LEKLLKNRQKMPVYSVFLLKVIIFDCQEARWRCCLLECAGAGAAFCFSVALLRGSASGLLGLKSIWLMENSAIRMQNFNFCGGADKK